MELLPLTEGGSVNAVPPSLTGLVLAGGSLFAQATQPAGGPDLLGVAAIISAFAALVASVGGIILGLRKRSVSDEVLLELLKKHEDDD